VITEAYNASAYDGLEGLKFRDIQASYDGSSTSALTNGFGNYGTGVYFVKDWRGGDQNWEKVSCNSFQYCFWGIQSDINHFTDVQWRQNEVAVYLGPNSSQNDFTSPYWLHNDNSVSIDGATQTKFWGGVDNSSGSSAGCAFKLLGSYAGNPTKNTAFYSTWFENSIGQAATAINCFVDIGTGASVQVLDTYFIQPHIIDRTAASTPRTKYLASMDNGEGLYIFHPQGDQIDSLVQFTGATSPTNVRIEEDRLLITAPILNSGAGTPQVFLQEMNSSTGTVILDNQADAGFTVWRIKAGLTASQNREFRWVGFNNVTDWQDQVSSAHNRNIVDTVCGINRLALTQSGASALNSCGATADNFNVANGTGTGGSAFGDGAGNTTATISSAGLGTFNGGVKVAAAISPTVAGAQTAGTNALPFSSVFIGAAATNNAQLTGTFTAARVQTLPDITGNVSVYLSGSDAAVDLALVATAACTAERTVAVTGAAFGDAVDVMAGTALEAGRIPYWQGHVFREYQVAIVQSLRRCNRSRVRYLHHQGQKINASRSSQRQPAPTR
jgi:hypothetical protein